MTDWRHHATCSEHEPATTDPWFFPTGVWQGPNESVAGYEKARALCTACPVRYQCLAAAIREEGNASRHNRYGMRGGMTPSQRRHLFESQQDAARLAELAARFAGKEAS